VRGIAFYGKGGIGKTTVSSSVTQAFGASGRRVLHIGCDPKHDSCYRLVPREQMRTVMGALQNRPDGSLLRSDIVMSGPPGIDCIETGGPEPGIGCAGRGITRTFEAFRDLDLLSSGYDVAVFDVLGDVVCGGFAVPMRSGLASEVYVVTSGEVMAMYAANNICRAISKYARTGVRMGGLVGNLRWVPNERIVLERFARALGSRLLHPIPFDQVVQRAERAFQTVGTFAPGSPAARHYEELFAEVDSTTAADLVVPTPMSETQFDEFITRECTD